MEQNNEDLYADKLNTFLMNRIRWYQNWKKLDIDRH